MKHYAKTALVWGLSSFVLGTLIGMASQQGENIPELPDTPATEQVCCASMEEREVQHEPIWFLDPMDEQRVNIPAKYKGANYLLFTNGRSLFHFDLTMPTYDANVESEALEKVRKRVEKSKERSK